MLAFSPHFVICVNIPIANGAQICFLIAEKERFMSFLALVVVAAAFATVVALVSGISSPATDREVGHFDSAHWMEVSNNIASNARLSFRLQ